jgi:putative colanic acid biosynthesis UDP-glucose lipid carrier transferase
LQICCDRWVYTRIYPVERTFEIRKDYGYQFLGYFSDKKEIRNQGKFTGFKDLSIANHVDEIYCSSEVSNYNSKI